MENAVGDARSERRELLERRRARGHRDLDQAEARAAKTAHTTHAAGMLSACGQKPANSVSAVACSTIGVSTMPGITNATCTGVPWISMRSASVRPTSANFVAQ